jgi:5-methylcytosine-specific restriction protein A
VKLSDVYGAIAETLIHVHHVKPISEVGESYMVDPISDLIPVCPNCHAVIHLKTPPYAPQYLSDILLKNQEISKTKFLKN